MKKVLGITFGGLQKKAILLVVIVTLILVAMFVGITMYQNSTLVEVVGNTRVEQQNAISQMSRDTMHQTVEESLVSS